MLVFLLARRLFGPPAALIATALASSYWVLVYYEMELLEPTLLLGLGLLMIYAMSRLTDRASWVAALGAGAVAGAFALVRPNVLLFYPVALAWILWLSRRRANTRRAWTAVLGAFLGGIAITLAPATIRNYLVGHDFVLISANAGVNLLIGNNPSADGMFTDRNLAARFASCYDYPSLVAHLEKETGRPMKYSGASAHFAKEALRFALTRPHQFMGVTLRKAILFWCPVEMGHNKEEHFERLASPILRALPGNFAFVLGTCVLGIVMWISDGKRRHDQHPCDVSRERQKEAVVLILLFGGTYYLSFLPFFVAGQYRVPLIPFLQIFSAYAILGLVRDAANRRFRRACLQALAGLALYAGASINWTGYQPSLPKWHFDRGVAHGKEGHLDLAILDLKEAARIAPEDAEVHYNLGLALGLRGQLHDALAHFSRATRLKPDYAEAHFNTGVVMVRLGRIDDAIDALSRSVAFKPDFAEAQQQLGHLLGSRGRCSEAIPHLEATVALRPGSPSVTADLVQALLACQRAIKAVQLLRQSIRRYPQNPAWMNQLAWIEATHPSAEVRNAAEALSLAQRMCSLTQSNVPAFLDTLAAAYAEAGRFDDALRTSEKALQSAVDAGDTNLVHEIQERRHLYGIGRPFRSEPGSSADTASSANDSGP